MTAPQRIQTIVHVIDMFAGLNLPVTDDSRQIEARGNELQNLYLRRKGSTDPQQRNQADVWFKNLTDLKFERAELIAIVRDHFAQLADTALAVALSSRINTLTPEVYAQLEQFALEQCRCDPPLARDIVESYLRQRGLALAGALVSPQLVEQFTAVAAVGQVELSWKLPDQECDEVIVRRFALDQAGSADPDGQELCRGRRASYVDPEIVAGQRYRYAVLSIWRGVVSQTSVAVETTAIAEISGVTWRRARDHVRLIWRKPSPNCEVFIFRARSALAPVQRGAPDPLPDNPEALLVYRGQASEWRDRKVQAGDEYQYLLVAFFGPSCFSGGVNIVIRLPAPPPSVSAVTAVYQPGQDEVGAAKDEVAVDWAPVSFDAQPSYVVVRREGGAPPGRVEDGEIIETTIQTRCLDVQVVPGRRYSYAVFSYADEIYSRTGAAAPPVDILAEVTAPVAIPGDGTVELHWRTPINVSQVIVRRDVVPPGSHADGALVRLTGAGHAKDEQLDNGQCYHYLICCAYRPDGAAEVISPGVRLTAIPERLPDLIAELAVHVQGLEIHCDWAPPAYGQAVLLRSARQHGLRLGQRLTVDELDRLGERIITEAGRARDAAPDINRPYYSLFTVAGSQAITGGSGQAIVCLDVANLKLAATRDGVILRWSWPPGCVAVRIARRLGAWPDGPDDQQASHMTCTRVEYTAAGEAFIDAIQEGRWHFHYIVYAQAAGAPGLFFAPGVDPGCRAAIQWEPWMTLRYRLEAPGKEAPKGQALRLAWSVEQPFPNFSGFVLIAAESEPPAAPDDGIPLFHWAPDDGQVEGDHTALVSLAPVHRRRWARFYCKAFVNDPAQRPTTLIVHPDTTQSISEQGEPASAQFSAPARVYRAGVPRTVICPYCFEEFPIEQMLFDSFTGGEARPARYTWFDRLRSQPPRPPRNEQGQPLHRKLCPKHRHVLPYTAGSQSSLVIGVIGAKFSGKSHYIAALVERLAGQVASDLQANLLPATDETHDRYQREFYDPLFGKGIELPATVGAPPPLIYDLALDGALWGEQRSRAITLALYDTAGENFDDRHTVQQMVQYLRVASGIIFLVDPLQSPAVREALPRSAPLPNIDLMAESHHVIGRVLNELENGKMLAEAGPLATPVAVVLTKCDVLRDAGLIDANRLWSADKRHIGYFDREAHNDMTGMIGEYVRRWSTKAYATVRSRFSRHAFFGVSSTGCAPDKTTRLYKYISPWRVEDPLLWLLAELKVIPAR